MMSEIEAGAAKTKHALTDATETVADTAKAQGSRLEKLFRVGMKALPLLPERSFEYFLDRVGLERKRSGFAGFAMFAGGFAAGSLVTAFTTPISGSDLRKKVWSLAKNIGDGVEEKVEEMAGAAVDAEKKLVQGAKDLVSDVKGGGAKDVAADMKSGVKDLATDVKNGAKDLATDAKNGVKDLATDAKDVAKDVASDGKGSDKDFTDELHRMKRGIDSRTAGADGNGRNGGGFSS